MQEQSIVKAGSILDRLRSEPPLVQIITNYVTVNDVANALLCLGGSPAMVEAEAEAASFAKLAQALYLNVGTLSAEQSRAMPLALRVAREKAIPVVLDPVACGAFPEKMAYVRTLLAVGGVSIIKGNAAEIMSLSGKNARSRGVDSLESDSGLAQACLEVAKSNQAVVMATGKVDTVSDGRQVWTIRGGCTLLERVSGTGCILGGLLAATVVAARASGGTDLEGCLAAACAFGLAAERAASLPQTIGPMSFKTALLDSLSALSPEELDTYAARSVTRI